MIEHSLRQATPFGPAYTAQLLHAMTQQGMLPRRRTSRRRDSRGRLAPSVTLHVVAVVAIACVVRAVVKVRVSKQVLGRLDARYPVLSGTDNALFRVQAMVAAAAMAAFAIVLAATGPHLASLYRSSGIVGCRGADCGQLARSFLSGPVGAGLYPVVFMLGTAAIVLTPAVIGIFRGAPLIAHELETGTFRLAWTQSITRAQWLAARLALPGLAAMAVTEGLSLMYGWWAASISEAARLSPDSSFPLGMSPFNPLAFAAHGLTPLGYAAFGFALGASTGVLLRRAVPAMAVTLAIFAAVQVAMPLAIRPHLFPPARTITAIGSGGGSTGMTDAGFTETVDYLPSQPGAWILSSQAVNAAGQPTSTVPAACTIPPPGKNGPRPAIDPIHCLASHGIRVAVTYQPASRYCPPMGRDRDIPRPGPLALAGYCFRRLNRRLC